jgi:hypothetical protein
VPAFTTQPCSLSTLNLPKIKASPNVKHHFKT